MKKITILIFTLGTLLQAQAQSDTLTPLKGDKQFIFSLNTNSAGFTFKHYCTNKTAFRLGISGSMAFNKSGDVTASTTTLSNGVVIVNPDDSKDIYANSKQTSMGLKLGLQKSFLVQKTFEPYFGADIVLNNTRSFTDNSNVNYYTNGNSYNRVVSKSSVKTAHGMNIALSAFVGFNYYIVPRFALGAEFSVLPIYLNHNGTTTTESSSINTTTNTIFNNNNYSKTQKGNTTIGNNFNGTAQITATILLNKRK